MSQGLRYKFNGSHFYVGIGISGTSPSPAITGISLTNPVIVSTAPQAHGLVSSDVAKIYGITTGPTGLNNRLFAVDNATTNDFDLAGEDGTMNTAWSVGGKVDKVSFSEYCELTGANQQDAGADEIEVTTICSTAKEFEQGLSDSGTLQLDYNAAPNGTVETALRAAKISGAFVAFKIVFANSGGTVIMLGTVQSQSLSGSVNDVWKGSATIKLSGPIFVTD